MRVCVHGCSGTRIPSCYLCRPKEIGRDLLQYVTSVSAIHRRDILTASWLFTSPSCAFLHVHTACLANSLWKRYQTLVIITKKSKLSTTCLPALKACRFLFVNKVQSIMKQDLHVADSRQGWYSFLGLPCVKFGKATKEYNQYFGLKLLNVVFYFKQQINFVL